MSSKSAKLLLVCMILTSPAGAGFAQDASKQASADPTEIIRSIVQDPAIKNFVGPSENAWDFSAPDGVPGFGPLSRVGNTQ